MFSQYHAGSFNAVQVLIIPFAVFAIYWKKDNKLKNYVFAFFLLCSLILIGKLLGKMPWTITHSFQFDRFYFLYPSLCFVLLAKAFSLIRHKWFVVVLSMVLAMMIIVVDGALLSNVRSIIGKNTDVSPSFSQFFDEKLFAEIKKDLKIEDNFTCKIVSLGMYPSVAEYNNFYTLDSYVFSYSLDYKHKFRKIIKGELEKSVALRKYFDEWGSRCYIFSSELGLNYLYSKDDNIGVSNLSINSYALKELGCDYVFSTVDIFNYRDLNLSYVNSYTSHSSYYKIRVYKLY